MLLLSANGIRKYLEMITMDHCYQEFYKLPHSSYETICPEVAEIVK